MADVRKIRVMISSRSVIRVFGGTALSKVREHLHKLLEGIRWHGPSGLVGRDQALFDVWIHENDPGREATGTTLDMSLSEIDKADLILVLYTGEAGSAADDSEIGICHAELLQALARRADIVAIVGLLPINTSKTARDVKFRHYVDALRIPRRDVDSEAALSAQVTELLQQLTSTQVRRGVAGGTHKRDRGQALDWSRLDLEERRRAMREVLLHELEAKELKDKSRTDGSSTLHSARLVGVGEVGVRADAIAAAWSVAAVRLGQPFLSDYRHAGTLANCGIPGVVHVIACHRAVNETQALRMLGTPDAFSVSSDFGVYVADRVQQIQMIFLNQCADEGSVALAVRRLREWLALPGPGVQLTQRARSRHAILNVVAEERHKMESETQTTPTRRRTT